MTTPPSLSLVIPCYNEAESIGACLDAALTMRGDLHEIIIVDNNSSDKTVDIIKQYQKREAKIQLLYEKRQGVQYARNTGFDAVRSDIIGRIDADTLLGSDWAKNVKHYYADPINSKVGVASGYSCMYDLPFQRLARLMNDMFTIISNEKLAGTQSIYGANMTLRRSSWQKIRNDVCMRTGIMEDQDTGHHIAVVGETTGFIRDAEARVSGRRMRMSPLRYWRYNKQWWMTYANHGDMRAARRIRIMAWGGNILQAVSWVGLLFFDPHTRRLRLPFFHRDKDERIIP